MNIEKKKRLEISGWMVGGTADFLQLSPEGAKFIELKLALAAAVREQREKRGLTQTEPPRERRRLFRFSYATMAGCSSIA